MASVTLCSLALLCLAGLTLIRSSPTVVFQQEDSLEDAPSSAPISHQNAEGLDAYESEVQSLKDKMDEDKRMVEDFEQRVGRFDMSTDDAHQSAETDEVDDDSEEETDDDAVVPTSYSGQLRHDLGHYARSAFYAYLSHDIHHLGHNQIIRFDKAVTNINNLYNVHTGVFIARYQGYYVITWTTTNRRGHFMETELVANGQVVGRRLSDSHGRMDSSSATGTVVILLKPGNHVFVRSTTRHDRHLTGHGMTSFSGWMIH